MNRTAIRLAATAIAIVASAGAAAAQGSFGIAGGLSVPMGDLGKTTDAEHPVVRRTEAACTRSSQALSIFTPSSRCTFAAGKLSKVHRPSSAKAGAAVSEAQAASAAPRPPRNVDFMGLPYCDDGSAPRGSRLKTAKITPI